MKLHLLKERVASNRTVALSVHTCVLAVNGQELELVPTVRLQTHPHVPDVIDEDNLKPLLDSLDRSRITLRMLAARARRRLADSHLMLDSNRMIYSALYPSLYVDYPHLLKP